MYHMFNALVIGIAYNKYPSSTVPLAWCPWLGLHNNNNNNNNKPHVLKNKTMRLHDKIKCEGHIRPNVNGHNSLQPIAYTWEIVLYHLALDHSWNIMNDIFLHGPLLIYSGNTHIHKIIVHVCSHRYVSVYMYVCTCVFSLSFYGHTIWGDYPEFTMAKWK